MLGRLKLRVPVFIWRMALPWSTPSLTMERMTQSSSANLPTLGKRSLTGMPLCP